MILDKINMNIVTVIVVHSVNMRSCWEENGASEDDERSRQVSDDKQQRQTDKSGSPFIFNKLFTSRHLQHVLPYYIFLYKISIYCLSNMYIKFQSSNFKEKL